MVKYAAPLRRHQAKLPVKLYEIRRLCAAKYFVRPGGGDPRKMRLPSEIYRWQASNEICHKEAPLEAPEIVKLYHRPALAKRA